MPLTAVEIICHSNIKLQQQHAQLEQQLAQLQQAHEQLQDAHAQLQQEHAQLLLLAKDCAEEWDIV